VNFHEIIQTAASVANVLTVVVFGVGYYFMIKLYREWVGQSRAARVAGGRPLVVVALDHSHLPEVGIVVRNFHEAPAKEVSFGFSAPVEAPDGTVISDLPYFQKGLNFIEPNGRIGRRWGRLPDLAPLLREKGLEDGIRVTTRYKDLAGESYESEWTLNPLCFEDSGIEVEKGMNDLVRAVESLSGGTARRDGRQAVANAES
jgi:hypothetical protein